jgi:S-DNA-T family DNA segregation ATPase FtsK/SpoIIIE
MVAVVVSSARGELEVELAPGAGAVVADVVAALGGVGDAPLYVDGRAVDARIPLTDAEISVGSTVSLVPPATVRARDWSEPVVELRVVGGLDAGARVPLTPGDHVVGRGNGDADVVLASLTMSLRHLSLSVEGDGGCVVRDLGSHNGTRIEGEWVTEATPVPPGALIQAGAVLLTVQPLLPSTSAPVGRPGPSGLVTFDRPPRRARPLPPPALNAPSPDRAGAGTPRFHWSAVITPLLMGGGMVMLTGQLMFAAFMLLSPVMAVANWVEERRHAKRDRAAGVQRFAAAMQEFTTALDQTLAGEVRRRRGATPDLAEVLAWPATPTTRLWERRPADPDFAVVGVGTATQRWAVPLHERGSDVAAEVVAAIAARSELSRVPLDLALVPGTVVGLVGDRAACLAVARSLVLQAAITSGPADLRIGVLAEPRTVAEWDCSSRRERTRPPRTCWSSTPTASPRAGRTPPAKCSPVRVAPWPASSSPTAPSGSPRRPRW